MKNSILIIEDNAYRAFTTKTVLEAFLHLEVELKEIAVADELDAITAGRVIAQTLVTPKGSVTELAATFKKQGLNRRNAKIVIVCVDDCDISNQLSLAA